MSGLRFIWKCPKCGTQNSQVEQCFNCPYVPDLSEAVCIHNFGFDMACDDCKRSGFRWEGVNDGTEAERAAVEEMVDPANIVTVPGSQMYLVEDQLADEGSMDGPGFTCERMKDKTMTEEKWRSLHEPHGEITRQDNLSQPPSYKLFWLICPCGARLQCMEELEGVD